MFAYINIGAGLPFISSIGAIIGLILAFLATFFLLLKRSFLLIWNRKIFKLLLIICGLLIVGFLGGIMMREKKEYNKVIILGMDGLDPNLIERFMEEGRLPNFSLLKEKGGYQHLKTVCPPQSPVVWTSIATGMLPGHHGIFDFVRRNPQNYKLDLALTKITPKGITLTRKGIPFWEFTSRHKIPTIVLHFPCTFPPDKVYGPMLSGMGVTDIRGTEGIYSFYTTRETSLATPTMAEKPRGQIFYLPKAKTIETTLPGPVDIETKQEIEIPIKLTIKAKSAVIELQNGPRVEIEKKTWSEWCKVAFSISPMKRVYGICRFYLSEIEPDFKLYCSPINFDPERPPFPISYPDKYSREVAEKLGLYYTQGEPYDTKALSDGVIDETAFLEHANGILKENEDLLLMELNQFKGGDDHSSGVIFSYFGYPDIIQHMFWRFIDPEQDEPNKDLYKDVIPECYQKMDALLGKVMKMIGNNVTLIVLSDHGFGPYRRAVNINTWLLENGFLFLRDGRKVGGIFFEDIDWPKTKAYSFGFGGIYLNIQGREGEGIVSVSEVDNIQESIVRKLDSLVDLKNNRAVVSKVYTKDEVFLGPYSNEAPDLYVGFNQGYRVSWNCALGGVEEDIIKDNIDKWSGEHMFDPEVVPGVLFMNREIGIESPEVMTSPSVIDIAPSILKLLDIKIPEEMKGKVLVKNEGAK